MSKEDLIEVLNIFDKLVDNNYGYYDGIDVEEQTNIIYDETIRCFNEKHQSTDCKELDEAAEEYGDNTWFETIDDHGKRVQAAPKIAKESFKAGANWQAQQSLTWEDVDVEKEIKRYQQEDWDRDTTIRDVARHFYKFGKKSK